MAIIIHFNVASTINDLTEQVGTLIDDNVLSITSKGMGAFYGLFALALTCYIIWFGARLVLGMLDGKEAQGAIMKVCFTLFLLVSGYALIPTMDFFGETAIKALKTTPATATNASQTLNNKAEALSEIRKQEFQLSEADIKNVKEAQAMVDKTKYKDATIDNAMEFNEESSSESLWSLIRGGIANFVAWILLIIGAICKMIITFFVLIIKGLLRVAFPIALSLSLMFKAEKALEAWWESYITVIMMSVTIAIISYLQQIMLVMFTTTSLPAAQLGLGIMAFAFGAAYLCAPTFTVMLFGGSQAAAQLPQQISTTIMGVAAITKTFTKIGILKTYGGGKLAARASKNIINKYKNI